MSDGSIRINTKIDTKEAKADIYRLEKEVEKTAQKITDAGRKMKTAFTGMPTAQMSGNIKSINKELDKTYAELEKINAEIAEIEADTDKELRNAKTDAMATRILEVEAHTIGKQIKKREELTAKAREYEAQLKGITDEMAKQQTLGAASGELKGARKDEAFLGSISTQEEYNQVLASINAKMAQIEQQADDIARKHGVTRDELLAQDAEYGDLAHKQRLLTTNAGRYAGKIAETKGQVRDLGHQATKAGQRIERAMSNAFRRVARLGIAMLGVEGAFTLLRRATMSYMESNETLANQMNSLWNVLGVAIGPVIEKLIGWLTVAISYINAFVFALTGVDLVAKANANAIKKQTAATNELSKSQKSLAGFDEMNKLTDTSASSGGGTSGGSAATFKTVDVDTSGVEKFKNILLEIYPLVFGIGAGLLTWKVLDTLGLPLKTCASWFLIIAGATTAITTFVDMLVNGVDWNSLIVFLAGIAMLAGGLYIAFGAIAAVVSVVAGGVMLIITGIKDWLENGKSLEALAAIEIGILAICLGISGIGVAIALVSGAIIGMIMYWEEVQTTLATLWAWVETNILAPALEFFGPLIELVKKVFTFLNTYIFQPAIKFIAEFLKAYAELVVYFYTKMWEIVKGVGKAVAAIAKKLWEIVLKVIEIFIALAKAFHTYILSPLWKWFKEIATKFYNAVIEPIASWVYDKIIKPVHKWVTWLADQIISKFKSVGKIVVDFTAGLFKGVINGILAYIEWSINSFIGMLNGAIKLINKIPGVNISKVSTLSIPRLAKGGIVNNPGRGVHAVIGEAGREAVLPLENNTEWMDDLADKIGGKKIVVQVILSGKKIHEELIDLARRREFATNGGI